MPYINYNGQTIEITQEQLELFNQGKFPAPAAGGELVQLNNAQQVLNPNTTNNTPGQSLINTAQNIATTGVTTVQNFASSVATDATNIANNVVNNATNIVSNVTAQADAALTNATNLANTGVNLVTSAFASAEASLAAATAAVTNITGSFTLPSFNADDDPFEAARLARIADEEAQDAINLSALDVDPGDTLDPGEEFVDNPFPDDVADDPTAIQADTELVENPFAEDVVPEDSPFPDDELVENSFADDVATEEDLALQDQVLTDMVLEQSPEPVDPASDEELQASVEAAIDRDLTDAVLAQSPEPVDPASDEELQASVEAANGGTSLLAATAGGLLNDAASSLFSKASQQAATLLKAKEQATLQARYKQPASSDWRVRLQLAPQANYLYKAKPPGILAPLYNTDGVIFPYTPSIETSYTATYDRADLVHSNYRGYFYKNSAVGDISIRGTFTAQDTQEADYLLAVIHFFRSVTKMFYGQDTQRGAPPPLVYLSGLGQYQFNQHPCVVSSFNYSLPTDVDYIRAGAPNNYGTNLLSARAKTNGAQASNAGSAVLSRLLSANLNTSNPTLNVPIVNQLTQNVNNLNQATYVPTKIEISLQLLPINTRSQISQQFSVKDFAAGNLIKGGFW